MEAIGGEYGLIAAGFGFVVAALLVVASAGTLAAGVGFAIPAMVCLGLGVAKIAQQHQSLSSPASTERELLSAISDNKGGITPAEAAIKTSLTVKKADAMLSELANEGHLTVESDGGSLVYSLPQRRNREID